MTGGFTLCPEGEHVFYIYDVVYDEDFGKLTVKMINAQGIKHEERFTLKDKNDQPNEKALNAFSYFAKTALNDFEVEDIDHTELIGHFIRCNVIHTKQPSRNDPSKMLTFSNLDRDKEPADGFDTEPTPEVRKLMGAAAPAAKPAPTSAKSLDALLGDDDD